mgnify:CR=1 FL=1
MKKIKLFAFVFSIFLFSCSENNETKIELTDTSDLPGTCDLTYEGTICCIQRNTSLELNKTVEYQYLSNFVYTKIEWEVLNGDIEIISDIDSNILKIKLRDNFNGGEILCGTYNSSGKNCSTMVTISVTDSVTE